jgi:hypothetical protein
VSNLNYLGQQVPIVGTDGTVTPLQLGSDLAQLDASKGLSVTITTAKLTGGGANGSMTFTNGRLTAQTAAT